jgi:hypothetical protein
MKNISYLLTVVILLFLFSCGEESNPVFDEENFTAIIDNNEFSASHFPIDIKQTPDKGYLILAERRLTDSNFRGVYLLKVDKVGNVVRELVVDPQYVNPVGDFMEQGGQYYFFCMDNLNQVAQIAQVDADATTMTTSATGVTYPAAAAKDGNNFILLSYNNDSKRTVLSLHNNTGNVVQGPKEYAIGAGDDVEEPIINHFIRTGKRFPFQTGKVGGLFYFNGFENYTFSMVFTDLNGDDSNGNVLGSVQGQQDDGGLSAIYPLGGSRFATAQFNFGDNYFSPNVSLQTNGASSSVELEGNSLPELTSNATVKIIKTEINTKSVLIYGSDTKSRQIGLFFYEETTGRFMSSRYLGFTNPFEIGNFTQTSDGGLVVCGTTYLAGRFPRICIFKLSKAELGEQLK